MGKKKKFYAVAAGRKPGIYKTWAECEKQVKGFRKARFKGFPTKGEAQAFISGETNVETLPVDLSVGATSATATVASASDQAAGETESSGKKWPAKRKRVDLNGRAIAIDVHFDGGSRGNPGVAGAGANVEITTERQDGSFRKQTVKVRKYLGTKATNNVAEYQGLICGLREAKNALTVTDDSIRGDQPRPISARLRVHGDSDLLIQQMNGSYQCKSRNLIALHQEAQSLVAEIKQIAAIEVSFDHVYRNENKIADALANEAMDARKSWTTAIDDDADDCCSADESSAERHTKSNVATKTPTRDQRWLDV